MPLGSCTLQCFFFIFEVLVLFHPFVFPCFEHCSYGSSYYGEELSDARFVRFCRDMGILGATSRQRGLLPQLDVDLIFIQAKPKVQKGQGKLSSGSRGSRRGH